MILDKFTLDNTILKVLDIHHEQILKEFKNTYNEDIDLISYTGDISEGFLTKFIEFIELVKQKSKNRILCIILNTPGGSAVAVEKMVEVIRFHYESLYFIVPSSAMSAGTIFCMAGDKIFMDYSSSLGPIDPQIHNGERWVPALGYIDKINELITKSEQGILTDAEFAMLQKLDLGTIRAYEQAKDLSIDLLKKWLVKYKFKSWTIHRTTINKIGQPVTEEEKEMRAKKIAQMLSDNNIWHSHGRFIGIETLKDLLKLEIDDYTSEANLRNCIITYNSLLQEFVAKNNRRVFFHTNLGE